MGGRFAMLRLKLGEPDFRQLDTPRVGIGMPLGGVEIGLELGFLIRRVS
jgi:hypothetical protein